MSNKKHLMSVPVEQAVAPSPARPAVRQSRSYNARSPMQAPTDAQTNASTQEAPAQAPAEDGAAGEDQAVSAEQRIMRRSTSEPWRRTLSNNGRFKRPVPGADAHVHAHAEAQPEAPGQPETDPSPVPEPETHGTEAKPAAAAAEQAEHSNSTGDGSKETVVAAASAPAAAESAQVVVDADDSSSKAAAKAGTNKQQRGKGWAGKNKGAVAGIAAAMSAELEAQQAPAVKASRRHSTADLSLAIEAPAGTAQAATSKGNTPRNSHAHAAAAKADGAVTPTNAPVIAAHAHDSAGTPPMSTTPTTSSTPTALLKAAAIEAVASGGHSRSASASGSAFAAVTPPKASPPLSPGAAGALQAYDRYGELLFRLQQFLPALKAKATQSGDFEATWEVLKVELGSLANAAKLAAQQAARLEVLDQEVDKLHRLLGLIGREVKSTVLQQQLKEIFKDSPLQPAATATKAPAGPKPPTPSNIGAFGGRVGEAMQRSAEPGKQRAPAPAKVITPSAAVKLESMYKSINRAVGSPKRLGYKIMTIKASPAAAATERRVSAPDQRRASNSNSPPGAAATASPRRSSCGGTPVGPTLAEDASFLAARQAFLSVSSPTAPRTDRWLQSIALKPKADSAEAVDKAMGQLVQLMKKNAVPLDITRAAPFTFTAAGKRMHIRLQSCGLVVRTGGGFEDLLTVLGRLPVPGLATGRSMDKGDMAVLLRAASSASGAATGEGHQSLSVEAGAAPLLVAA